MKYQLNKDSTVEVLEGNRDVQDIIIYVKTNSEGREDIDDAFYIGDLGDIVKKYKKFIQCLPNVEPFYAVKCNNEVVVLELLAKLGLGFDCASKREIQSVLNLGVQPNRIIYAQPCKQASHLRFAAVNDVSLMTFDNEMELNKTKELYPDAKLVIRIKVDDSKSTFKYGIKFGVSPNKSRGLLESAKHLGLNVVGVSFHAGSDCYDASVFYNAVKAARFVFDEAADVGFKFNLLDIGGGFPGNNEAKISFEEIADCLNSAFDEYFPQGCGVRIIAEPGTYFVSSAFSLVCNITSVRAVTSDDGPQEEKVEEGFMYYINDGVYGSFIYILWGQEDHYHNPKILDPPKGNYKLCPSSIWGPTCDSLDCISQRSMLPALNIGDWIYYENMGAYTISTACLFNGFMKPRVYYVISESEWANIAHLFHRVTCALL